MTVTLSELPNEVLQQVLYYLPPLSLPAFQLVNRRFSLLANGLIWRHVCTSKYRYWKSDHNIGEKLAAKVEQTNWKELYTQRHVIDRHTTQTLNSILSSQTGRIEKFQQILQYGYDAKDCLLWHYSSASDAEDVLARRLVP
jgi:F-box protein 21